VLLNTHSPALSNETSQSENGQDRACSQLLHNNNVRVNGT